METITNSSSPDFGNITCKHTDNVATKTSVAHTLQSSMQYSFVRVHDTAVVLTKTFLKQFEAARGKERESFASTFEGHHARIWEKAIETKPGSSFHLSDCTEKFLRT